MDQPGENVCILISTCDRYQPVAEWTEHCIHRSWHDHPPMHSCGLRDSRDWMTVTRDGVIAMKEKGFRWIYLVLDDHPPVGPCHSEVLNRTLPSLAVKLQVVNINLLGWGQRRGCEGEQMGVKDGRLLRNEIGYRWKFSLHPALWSADKLLQLLKIRMKQYESSARTPWNFERHRDVPDGPVGHELLNGTYRINGNAMALGSRLGDALLREPVLFCLDLWRFLIRILLGQGKRDAFDRENLWPYYFYRGPYPLFWSGAVRIGKPSRDFENFLRFTRRHSMRKEWSAVREKFVARC